MNAHFRWGIIGPGKIAHKFAQDIRLIENVELYAVASRSKERARIFAEKYHVPHFFDSYQAITACDELDAVYIATDHTGHCENTLMCLENKLPVLCEKPFAMNAGQVRRMIAAAKANDTFLMEALWTQFIPLYQKMLRMIGVGVIGKVKTIRAEFSFKAPFLPERRLFKKDMGGGALLDIGIYPVFLALSILGKPENIKAIATFGPTGIDENIAMLFRHGGDELSVLDSSLLFKTNTEAYIYGEKGAIFLPSRFFHPKQIFIQNRDGESREISLPYTGNGLYHEAIEVMDCLTKGKKESAIMPLSLSLDLIELLDAVRAEAGIVYPAFD